MKNYQGKVDGMKKTSFLQKRLDFEKEYQAWANSTPERKAKYADILSKEKAQYDVIEKTKDRDNVFGILQGLSGTLLNVASQIIQRGERRWRSLLRKGSPALLKRT